MPTPTGTISLSDVNIELGKPATSTITMDDSLVRTLCSLPSGIITLNNLKGLSALRTDTYVPASKWGFLMRTNEGDKYNFQDLIQLHDENHAQTNAARPVPALYRGRTDGTTVFLIVLRGANRDNTQTLCNFEVQIHKGLGGLTVADLTTPDRITLDGTVLNLSAYGAGAWQKSVNSDGTIATMQWVYTDPKQPTAYHSRIQAHAAALNTNSNNAFPIEFIW